MFPDRQRRAAEGGARFAGWSDRRDVQQRRASNPHTRASLSLVQDSYFCLQVQVARGVPDVTSGGISFSSIDFQKSKLSPVGFALCVFRSVESDHADPG